MTVPARIKVLHIASGDGWAGQERVISLLLEGLSSDGSADLEMLLLNEGHLAEVVRSQGVPVHVLSETRHSFGALVGSVRRWIAARRFDVIHAHRYKEVLIAALALWPSARNLIVTVHGLEPWARLTPIERMRCWLPMLLARLLGAQFVGVSDELTRRLARRIGTAHVRKISNPIPRVASGESVDLRARLGWDPQRPVVGFVGRLEEVKGPDHFLELAAQTTGALGFVMIGSGSMEGALRARVRMAGLASRVAFLGHVPDVSGYLRQLDVLALTSNHEGLPMVLLEAAACEVPVVAFDVGGVREVLDGSRAARVVPRSDITAFHNAVEAVLMEREQTRLAAASWGQSVRARFSLCQAVSSYLTLYRTLAPASRKAQ